MAEENFRVRKGITVDGTGDSSIAGNLGIGITSPGGLLDIHSTSGNQLRLSYNANYYWIMERDSSGKLNITNHQNSTDVKAITIDTTEQVGIGTTSPSSILHVKEASTINSVANSARMIVAANGGDSYIHLMESTDGHNIRHTASDNSLRFRSTLAGSDLMTLTSGGNLGIGTTSPDEALHVVGDIKASAHLHGTRLNIESTGYGSIEMGGPSGAFIDMKNPFSDDFDARLITDGDGLDIIMAGSGKDITLKTNGTQRIKIEDALTTVNNTLLVSNTLPELKLIDTDATNDPTARIINNGGNLSIRADSADVGTGGAILFETSGSEKIRLTDGGSLGIGTTGPVSELDLSTGALSFASTNTQLKLSGGSNVDFQLGHWGNTHILIDTDGNDSSRYFSVRHGNATAGSATELMRVQENGFVGIGTSSPDETLHVLGPDSGPIAKFERDGQESVYISGNNGWGNLYTSDAVLAFGTGGNAGGNAQMVLNGGNLGIGTGGTVDAKLHVEGSVLIDAYEQGAGAGLFFRDGFLNTNQPSITVQDHSGANPDGLAISAFDGISFLLNATEAARFDSAGDFGIGTTNPTAKLHVNGDIKCTGLDLQNGALEYGGGVQQSGDLAVGWYTFAVCKGRDATSSAQRAFGEFLINDVDSGRHGSCRLNASHMFGAGNSIQVFAYNFYSNAVFTQLRIKESGTYAGAALQVYVSNANNNLESYMTLSEQNQSWDLLDTWLADSDDSGHDAILGYATHSQDWSGFAASQTVDLSIFDVSQGGIYTTGGMYAEELELKDATGITIQTANSNARHKKIFATTSNDGSPWDEMVYYSRGSAGGWSGQHTFTVDKSGTSGTGYEALRIRDSGDGATSIVAVAHKLGVGITNPGHQLEVAGGGANGEIVVNRNSGAEILLQAQSATGVIGTNTNHDLAIKTNGSTRMHIENDGDVGIGTTSPDKHLHIKGSGAQQIKVESTDNNAGIELMSDSTNSWLMYSPNGSDDLRFYTETTSVDVLTLDATNKRVGIGDTSPNGVLHVYRNESATTVPLLKLHEDSVYADNPTLEVTTDRTDGAIPSISVSGGAVTVSGPNGWNTWEKETFYKKSYGTASGGGSGLVNLSHDGEGTVNSFTLPYDAKLRAVAITYSFSSSSSSAVDQTWRLFHSGDPANTVSNFTFDVANDMTNTHGNFYLYVSSGLDIQMNKNRTYSVRRESGTLDIQTAVRFDLWYTRHTANF